MTLSKKFKQSKKSVAAFLIFAMAISFLPAGMFSGFSREASDKEAYVLGEDVEKRKADEKHFIMSDGTMMAVKYSEQVHYQADAGKWVEIDNSLSYDTKLKKFTNKNNPTFTVDFPEDGRVSVSSEKGYTLSFSTSVIKGTKNVNISSSYDKIDINATGDGYNNGVGFDNVLNASNLLNYSITYDGSIIQIAGSKEAIFDYGYTEDDI